MSLDGTGALPAPDEDGPPPRNTILTLLDAEQLARFYAAGHWRPETIYGRVRQRSAVTPDKVAVREASRQASYAELVDAADRLAGALEAAGLRPGQRVAVWLSSRIETAVALLACSRNRYVCSPSLHRDHTVAEVTELLSRMRAAALIAETGYGADAGRADIFERAGELETLKAALAVPPRAAGTAGIFPELTLEPTSAPATTPDTVVYLAFTSGTTGEPKGVMHSDNTLLAPVRSLAGDWRLGADSVVYSISPLSHNLGFGAMLLALTEGGELVVHDLPRGASLLDRLLETGTTFLFGVPTHAIDLLAELRARGFDRGGRLQGFRISGSAVPAAVAEGLLAHGVTPQSGYGMTEAGSHHYTRPDDPAEVVVGTSGRACAGYEVRIFSQEDPDLELPIGEIGQIGGRGAGLMLGYFDDQRGTEESFNRQGWFLTGDLGLMDDAGNVKVTGRKKDIIIRGGHNIFPAKIEGLTLRHAAVDKAAAVPFPDERLGERVCLVVSLKRGTAIEPEELLEHLDAAGLSRYDMPEYFLRLDELPLMPSGKIFKRRLVEWLDSGRVSATPIRFSPKATGADEAV